MSEVVSVFNSPMIQFGNVAPVHNERPKQAVYLSMGESAVRTSPIHIGFKVCEIITLRNEALEKVTKNMHRLIDIGLKLQLITSKVLENCSTNLKTAVDLFDTIRVIGVLHLFFSPQENGKYFLFDKASSSYKKIDRLFLASHLVCKSARTLNKWRLLDLGRIAQIKIGQYLSAFTTFTDSLMVSSCIFNILDSSEKLEKFEDKKAVIEKSIKKLKERHRILQLAKEGNKQVIAYLKKIWEQKIVRMQQKLEQKKQDFSEHSTSKTKRDIRYLIVDIKETEEQLALIASGDRNMLQKYLLNMMTKGSILWARFASQLALEKMQSLLTLKEMRMVALKKLKCN